jgi:hypothetical protein
VGQAGKIIGGCIDTCSEFSVSCFPRQIRFGSYFVCRYRPARSASIYIYTLLTILPFASDRATPPTEQFLGECLPSPQNIPQPNPPRKGESKTQVQSLLGIIAWSNANFPEGANSESTFQIFHAVDIPSNFLIGATVDGMFSALDCKPSNFQASGLSIQRFYQYNATANRPQSILCVGATLVGENQTLRYLSGSCTLRGQRHKVSRIQGVLTLSALHGTNLGQVLAISAYNSRKCSLN